MAIHELDLDALAQTGEQRRPVSGKDWLHKELVLVDQTQICQRQGERHATNEQALAWLLLEPLNRLPQVASHQLGIPIDPAQRARHDVLLRLVDGLDERDRRRRAAGEAGRVGLVVAAEPLDRDG